MAAGAFQDISAGCRSPTRARGSRAWSASGRYGGKLYGVPYYAGSRVVTYRTDLFKQVEIAKMPTSQHSSSLAGEEARRRRTSRSRSRRSTSPGTDWYVAMSFVVRLRRKDRVTRKGKWVGTLDKPAALAGLAACKHFFVGRLSRAARRRTRRTLSRTRSGPGATRRRRRAPRGSPAASGLQEQGRAVRDAEPHARASRFRASSAAPDLAVPVGANKARGADVDQRLHRHGVHERPPREGDHPEHDQPAREQRQRARGPQELVRPARRRTGSTSRTATSSARMLPQILTGKLTVKHAASFASDNITSP